MEQARLIFLAAMAAVIALFPNRDFAPDLSALPCSVEEVTLGIRNWMEHDGCDHSLTERFRRGCLQMYYSHGLD